MDNDGKNTILVVDDEKLNLEVLNSILSPEYTIYMTKGGASAIKMADKYSPDLILLDIIMPDINGFEVLQALKLSEKTRHIPVIIITGLNRVEDEEKGLALDAADFIYKPFSTKIVKSRVRNQIQIVRQIRELVELHTNLEAAVNAAEAANSAKSSFLAKMSHELRTPLNAVLGISEVQLQNDTLPVGIKEAFSRIYSSGDLLLGIINDILDMSKIEAGKLELVQSQYDVPSLINDTVFLNIIKYEYKQIEFILNIDENIPSQLYGDELRIKQILNNLLSNAFKYTKSGEVELTFDSKEQSDSTILIFSVRDTGQGMTKEQVSGIFDDYSRFNSQANRTTEGIGLGMGITQNLIHMMNGEIQIESEPGKGTVFTVTLKQGNVGAPALGKETVEKLQQFRVHFKTNKETVQIVRDSMPSGKVLVVDDMDMNLYVAREMLSLYGLQIDTAKSGFEAIEKIKSNIYDIVFMDHMMPIMDGMETTGQIRKLGKEYEKLTIIALTANAVTGVREMFLANGFNGYISKPIKTQELDDVLKKWIPKEKVIQVEETKTAGTVEINESFFDDVDKIDEINIEDGLKQSSGNKDIYRNLLEMFYKSIISECNSMQDSLDAKDLKNFMITVHALKSILAMIGAMPLSKAAGKLESASKDNKIDYCSKNFSDFKDRLISLHKQLSGIFPDGEEEKTSIDKKDAGTKENVQTARALLVDDMDMILYVIKEKLSKYGLIVDTALNGQEAIEKIKGNAYDIVFMDHMMPGMDGVETTLEIRKSGFPYDKLTVIALTANIDPGVKEMFLANGFNGYLSKPIITEELELIFKEWMPYLAVSSLQNPG